MNYLFINIIKNIGVLHFTNFHETVKLLDILKGSLGIKTCMA